MRETTHRPKLENDTMDLGMLGMFLVQTAGVLALLGIIVLMIDRVIK